jgi:hypothetical protein
MLLTCSSPPGRRRGSIDAGLDVALFRLLGSRSSPPRCPGCAAVRRERSCGPCQCFGDGQRSRFGEVVRARCGTGSLRRTGWLRTAAPRARTALRSAGDASHPWSRAVWCGPAAATPPNAPAARPNTEFPPGPDSSITACVHPGGRAVLQPAQADFLWSWRLRMPSRAGSCARVRTSTCAAWASPCRTREVARRLSYWPCGGRPSPSRRTLMPSSSGSSCGRPRGGSLVVSPPQDRPSPFPSTARASTSVPQHPFSGPGRVPTSTYDAPIHRDQPLRRGTRRADQPLAGQALANQPYPLLMRASVQ